MGFLIQKMTDVIDFHRYHGPLYIINLRDPIKLKFDIWASIGSYNVADTKH